MTAQQLLDLIDLFDSPADLAAVLRSGRHDTTADVVNSACPACDRTTRRTAQTLLVALDVADSNNRIIETKATSLADAIELALDVRSEMTARRPPPASQLVVTATTSSELAALQRTLHLRSLFQLVEDVIRAARDRCVLGAPYWNNSALDRLRPALSGLARRGANVEFICQAARSTAEHIAVEVLNRCCRELLAAGATSAEVWAFDVRDEYDQHAAIHAKFALADTRLGYLGSANMTGQGFAEHFEIGVRLAPAEASDLALLIDRLRAGSFLTRLA